MHSTSKSFGEGRAKIARGFGQAGYAEMLFLRARDGFVAEGIPYDTALVSLELATLHAEQGRTGPIQGRRSRAKIVANRPERGPSREKP